MFYTVYKTTNVVNGKVYVGVHKTNNLDDEYLGSGTVFKKALKKYGVESFKKEILKIFDNAEEMFIMESLLVNEEFVKRNDTYNLKIGGSGSWDSANNHGKNIYSGHDKQWESIQHRGLEVHLEKIKNDENYRLKWIEAIQQGSIEYFKNHDSWWTGRRHTDKTKAKIGKANSKYQKGTGNSQFGTCWIFKEGMGNKKVKKDEVQTWLDDGWIKGRKQLYTPQ